MRWNIIILAGLLAGCHAVDVPQSGTFSSSRWMVCANDRHYNPVNGADCLYEKPEPDSLTILDVSTIPPKSVIGLENVPCSLIGPPVCVAVTPNQKYALVASAMKIDPDNPSQQIPDNRLSVIRLFPDVPEIVQQIETGQQPSSVEIDRTGRRVLIANRADGTVSLFALAVNGGVSLLGTFNVANVESSVSHAAFSPDGRHVMITLNKAGAVLFCSLEHDQLVVRQKLETGNGPYCMEFTPDGEIAAVGNVFEGSLSILQIQDETATVIDTIPVGITVEGLDISPDGQWMVVNCLENTNLKPDSPVHRDSAMVVLLQKQKQTFVTTDIVRVDGIPQAAVFTPDGKYVAVASNQEQSIQFYRVRNGELFLTGIRVACSGGPAAMRISQ